MSLLIGLSFVDEAILISDSRVTFKRINTSSKDELRKVYQIGPNLSVGFTSTDVPFTLKLLKKMTKYSIEKAKHKATLYLLDKLPRVAKFEYDKISRNHRNKKPAMEFIFSGVVKDRGVRITKDELLDRLNLSAGSAELPPQIAVNILKMDKGWIPIAPPSTVITKQTFPSGNVKPLKSLGIIISGTGSSILDHISTNYKNMFCTIPTMRYTMLIKCFESFYRESGETTVGGLIQILSIKAKGVTPITYSENRIDNNGHYKKISSTNFKKGEWIAKDEHGKIIKVRQNPLQ